MEDKTNGGIVIDHDDPQHQVELQLEAHPEVSEEEDLLLAEYYQVRRLEGAINDSAQADD